ncbi:MAG: hypothetical protein E6Q97_04700 [Desulfurellales bacterium]|nr:MAG: hypothetical protein E6Q97_04700 [Desulfurellales bacterium]
MPTYEYRCRMCDWKRVRRAPLYTAAISCEACGETAYRNPINNFNVKGPVNWGGETLPGHDQLRDEILGYAEEVEKGVIEARENGWTG